MEHLTLTPEFSEGDTEKPKEEIKLNNIKKSINISSFKKSYEVDFVNEIKYLSIIAMPKEDLFPIKFSAKFTLSDIRKVGLFRDYESIDECLFDIFEGLDSKEPKPNIIEKDDSNLTIIVPLHTKRYPEIIFPLKQNPKNNAIKYEELANAFLNMKKQKDQEIEDLKDRIDKLEKLLQIKIEKSELKENFKGTTLEIFNIGKNEYSKFFPDKYQDIEKILAVGFTLILECNEKDIVDLIISSFYKYKTDLKKLIGIDTDNKLIDLNIRNDKNKIYFDWLLFKDESEENKEEINQDLLFNEMMEAEIDYIPFILNGLKAKLITDATLIDLFELKNQEKINEIVYNTKLIFEGEPINPKY